MAYDIIIGRDEADKVKFGNEGLIYLGKGYVKMGTTSSLSNKIMMDVARSHVCLIAGKRGCLVGDTSIFTNKGYKSIKDFDEKNDKVLSFNKDKKSFEWENAQLLKYPIKDEKLLKIEFTDGREIILTKEHPLLSVSGNELLHLQWTNANELMRGDEILSIGKSSEELLPLKIKNIEEAEGITEVYDLSVDKNHSFIANGIISHNSGKSYTLGVIAEELANLPGNIAGNIATLIFDTMGIFWTMAYENEKEGDLLKEWQMQPRKLPVRIFVPFGYAKKYEEMGIPVTSSFAIKTSELDADDWVLTFGLEMLSPPSILIQRVINELRERKKEFDLDDILFFIKNDVDADKDTKAAATNLFEAAGTWGIFARKNEKGTAIKELVEGGKTSIIDMSVYSSIGTFNVRALVIGLITKKLFQERMISRKLEEIQAVQHGMEYLHYKEKREMPLVWMLIDELHEFLPEKGKTPATDALIQLLREGRQPGLSLVGATQQPAKVHTDVWTQSDIVLSHRVTAKPDIEALGTIMQSYLAESITGYMNNLPNLKGSAIILDDNSERIYPMRMRGRMTWHGGESPTSVKVKKRI